jgi:hypothetical protein
VRRLLGGLAVGLVATGCSGAPGAGAGDAASTTASKPLAEVVSDESSAADRGCVDSAGEQRATAAAWYPDRADGVLLLGGQAPANPSVERTDAFRDLVLAAVAARIPDAEPGRESQVDASGSGCTTHRWVDVDVAGGQLVVTEWRVVHAAAPSWIADETGFRAVDDATLVSDGTSLRVVLAVAPDGTTLRVGAYGDGALDRYAGWPTTMAALPGAPPPGPAPTDLDTLTAIAHDALGAVLAGR